MIMRKINQFPIDKDLPNSRVQCLKKLLGNEPTKMRKLKDYIHDTKIAKIIRRGLEL